MMEQTRRNSNQITGPNAGGPRQFPIRTSLAARAGQFCRWPMKRAFQHVVPSGLTTAGLYYLAEAHTDEVIGILFPHEVSTLDVVAYHLIAFGLSAGFTAAVPLTAARFVVRLEERRRAWAWLLPVVVPIVLWCCFMVGVRSDSFLLYSTYGLAFLASIVCAVYCGILILERLTVFGFGKWINKNRPTSQMQ
jgi:hypothetical protein